MRKEEVEKAGLRGFLSLGPVEEKERENGRLGLKLRLCKA